MKPYYNQELFSGEEDLSSLFSKEYKIENGFIYSFELSRDYIECLGSNGYTNRIAKDTTLVLNISVPFPSFTDINDYSFCLNIKDHDRFKKEFISSREIISEKQILCFIDYFGVCSILRYNKSNKKLSDLIKLHRIK